jgi:hypothetical protein
MAEMKPGDQRVFKQGQGKSVVLAIGVWAKRDGKHLRIDVTGAGTHTTVSNNPESVRYHRTLFRNLRMVLVKNGCWQFGREGSETEDSTKAAES